METEYYLWIGLEPHEQDVRTHETHIKSHKRIR